MTGVIVFVGFDRLQSETVIANWKKLSKKKRQRAVMVIPVRDSNWFDLDTKEIRNVG